MAADHPLVLLSRAPKDRFPPLYPEFSEMTLRALLVELRRNLPTSKHKDIDDVLSKLTRPPFDALLSRTSRRADLLCTLSKMTLNELVAARWKDGPFENLRCGKDNPFCFFYRDEQGRPAEARSLACGPGS
jgi:hypothetical protein